MRRLIVNCFFCVFINRLRSTIFSQKPKKLGGSFFARFFPAQKTKPDLDFPKNRGGFCKEKIEKMSGVGGCEPGLGFTKRDLGGPGRAEIR